MSQSRFPFDEHLDGAGVAARLANPVTSGHYDELLAGDGALRSAWRAFFERLGSAAIDDLPRREAILRRQVREHGVTYNVYSDEHGPARRWSLDLLPFIIDADDWKTIEAAVRQRSAVLSAIMRDAYGPRELLRDGLLPPALVLGSPGFLRPLDGVRPPGDLFLHVIAFDLARGPDGHWWVLGHRTQAPSGLGYALENRLIVARLFGEVFSSMRVQRLAASYRRMLDTLLRHAPRESGDSAARIVLLTPGRFNETYFEQSYLAHYLGVPLVEGEDLTVREDRVYLKTLHGLDRVHAIIRRVDDVFCDPLELRPDSALGVPGLVHAMRCGHVLVANSLGGAFLESPAIHGFLPAVARRVLDQELLLPPRDSWWCGEGAAREQAFATLQTARVRATYRGVGEAPRIARGTGLLSLAEVRQIIESEPDLYTIQSYLPYSKTPCWSRQALVARSAVVRVFAIANGEGGWHVMPGGLTRIADRQDEVSMQRGGGSADTWVITGESVDPFTMLVDRLGSEELVSRRRIVSSRAAENLFWMGRYSERSEIAVRAVQLVLSALRESAPLPASVLEAMGAVSLSLGLVPPGTPGPAAGRRVFERTLLANLRDERASSLAFDLSSMAASAAQIRDRLALEHWRQITSTVDHYFGAVGRPPAGGTQRPETALPLDEALAAMTPLVAGLAAITGAQTDGMTRDDGWRLLTIGRQLERLVCMAEVLAAYFAQEAILHEAAFDQALALFNSTVTYRSRYQGQRDAAALVDLLVLEETNPRALACMVRSIGHALDELCQATGEAIDWPGVGYFDRPRATLLNELCVRDSNGRFRALLGRVRDMALAARELSSQIGLRLFSHSEPMRSQIL
jgi:uncharacterized circularly permuted ATP-grasp superfamily protein/uncharacterized alpha-E superfamily protein